MSGLQIIFYRSFDNLIIRNFLLLLKIDVDPCQDVFSFFKMFYSLFLFVLIAFVSAAPSGLGPRVAAETDVAEEALIRVFIAT